MVAITPIEWTDRTWNLIRGCQMVNEQCQHCYAMGIAYRFSGKGQPYEDLAHMTSAGVRWTGKIKLVHELLKEPMKWKKPQRIFVNSMSDLFHDDVPFEFLYKAFETMLLTPRHTYQILTKRPQRMLAVMKDINFHLGRNYPDIDLPLRNVWLGVSAGTQKSADEFIPLLLETSAAIRFVSCEPLLEELDIRDHLHTRYHMGGVSHMYNKLDWVIVGAESGHGARPMNEDWVSSLQWQCQSTGTSFFYKQKLDERGKKVSLPVLNGRQWAEFPSVEGA